MFYEPLSCPGENVKLFKRCENNYNILHNIVTAVDPFWNVYLYLKNISLEFFWT